MKNLYDPRTWKMLLPAVFSCLFFTTATAQPTRTVSGRVTGDKNDPLPGVNISVKGTTTGTISNAEGGYALGVPDGNVTLVFSFVGYTTEEVAVGDRSTLDVSLVPDIKALGEVVVVGYGTQRKA